MSMEYGDKLIDQVGASIPSQESEQLIRLVNAALKQATNHYSALEILQLVSTGGYSTGFNLLALYVNRLARELSHCKSAANRAPVSRSLLHLREMLEMKLVPHTQGGQEDAPAIVPEEQALPTLEAAISSVYRLVVHRTPGAAEIDLWKTHVGNGLPFHEFLMLMLASPEAQQKSVADKIIQPDASDGQFVQVAYEVVLGRGAAAWEINTWLSRLEDRSVTRAGMLAALFEMAARRLMDEAEAPVHDGLSCSIMGTEKFLSAVDWEEQAQRLGDSTQKPPDTRYRNRFAVSGEPRILVSALASLYRGGDFIEQFMDNITGQDGFDDFAELVIVDADSPENEYETIKRYLSRHKNINYIRVNYRIGIYDAWNMAAKAARGAYLTNTNLDDLRRHDSFLQQAAALENLPFVDVVYQDLYYTFDPRLTFDEIAAFGHETALPLVTPLNIMRFNSPHNAPMWRKRLHDELGYFDIRYRSAGDYEFWMRCLAAGKKFYKLNDPHVVYYQNPKGISTRPDTHGVAEAMQASKEYNRKLTPAEVVMSREQFVRSLKLPWPESMEDGGRNRYELTQRVLRNLARRRKYGVANGADA